MNRKEVLDAAVACVMRDRNSQYGEPEDNFRDIAAIWSVQLAHKLKEPIRPSEVASLMIGVKLSRIRLTPQFEDHWVDIAGYAACGAQCEDMVKPKPAKLGPKEDVLYRTGMAEALNQSAPPLDDALFDTPSKPHGLSTDPNVRPARGMVFDKLRGLWVKAPPEVGDDVETLDG